MCKTILTESLGSIRPHCGCGLVYILRVFRAGTKVTSGRFWSWFLLWMTFCRCLSSWRFFFSCLCCSFLCLFDTYGMKKKIWAPHIYAHSICVGEEHPKIVALCLTLLDECGATFALWALLPSAGGCSALQSATAAVHAGQDPEAHWPWQDWPNMEPSSHSALMVAALSWSRFSSSPVCLVFFVFK